MPCPPYLEPHQLNPTIYYLNFKFVCVANKWLNLLAIILNVPRYLTLNIFCPCKNVQTLQAEGAHCSSILALHHTPVHAGN